MHEMLTLFSFLFFEGWGWGGGGENKKKWYVLKFLPSRQSIKWHFALTNCLWLVLKNLTKDIRLWISKQYSR